MRTQRLESTVVSCHCARSYINVKYEKDAAIGGAAVHEAQPSAHTPCVCAEIWRDWEVAKCEVSLPVALLLLHPKAEGSVGCTARTQTFRCCAGAMHTGRYTIAVSVRSLEVDGAYNYAYYVYLDDHCSHLTAKQFLRMYRMSKETFTLLRSRLALRCGRSQRMHSRSQRSVPVEVIMCVTLRLLAGASYFDVSWPCSVATATVYLIFHTTICVMNGMLTDVNCTTTADECDRKSVQFR